MAGSQKPWPLQLLGQSDSLYLIARGGGEGWVREARVAVEHDGGAGVYGYTPWEPLRDSHVISQGIDVPSSSRRRNSPIAGSNSISN